MSAKLPRRKKENDIKSFQYQYQFLYTIYVKEFSHIESNLLKETINHR